MRSVPRRLALCGALMLLALAAAPAAAERFITLASTTSTENSGLLDAVLPGFTTATGIGVRVVAVGTGQAIRLAERGDADVLLVHHEPSERRFVEKGHGVARHDVMYNDFVLVGPKRDPARVRGATDAVAALARIAATHSTFASRGDESGTHAAERALWREAGVDPDAASGLWYRETGSGMGATLNTATGMDAYCLTDRATWLEFANKGSLEILAEGDPRLFNQYGVILVNPERHPHVKARDGRAFVEWLLSETGQLAIGGYRIQGEQAFFPNAR